THAKGITQRDMRAAKILITKSGYGKLADFGLAKLVEETPYVYATATLTEHGTKPGMIVGTIAYMSPEQASGQTLDTRGDIFSFGVLFYELLARRRPFVGSTDLEVLQKVIQKTPQPLGEQVPVTLRLMVEKALAKDPAERYQSIRVMVVDLRRLARLSGDYARVPSRCHSD